MLAITALIVAAFLFGLITGIMVGWSAAPTEVWRTPKEEEAPKEEAPEPVRPQAVESPVEYEELLDGRVKPRYLSSAPVA
jgi:hypothetical protein